MKSVWVFNKNNANFSGGIFSELDLAESWIKDNRLSGVLTKYPLNQGVFDWAVENNMHSIKQEKLAEKSNQPNFIGGFTSARQEHYHYENGICV
ncbi:MULTISPECIES: DUF7710 domain-containing protein [unclassified Colwellia]|uniref:DUF7710 domain-containing protein n=1 Tax=unclassified Colwellia TaxID=196834 RepID=UPI0015F77323|nr:MULTISPECIES: hypothetical protein [unclassified Colwellia]MBA6231404.1 hypothetical protein [Colwellia sp. MB02u-7]MBA6234516.1 hypothetical protein [Colwellia sp. MB02u-11]MBA6297892.1 hypothetical protein [Colwellia sp. MB3u-22]MBA6312728.1 hypothetical protein [Colwellia sp. MB3u-64]